MRRFWMIQMFDGTSGELHADAIVPSTSTPGGENEAFHRALELVRNLKVTPISRKPLPWRVNPPRNQPYPDMRYPSLGYRLLAVFRIWNVIHYFFAYPDLIEGSWDTVLKEFIPKMEAARDSSEYGLTLAEMRTHLPDAHGSIAIGKALSGMIGPAGAPVSSLLIEGTPVITSYLDEPVARKAGVEIGDTIVAVNGEDAGARIARLAQYIPAANPEQRMSLITQFLFLKSPAAKEVRLKIRDKMDRIIDVTLPLSADYNGTLRTGDIVKLIPNNIGYADLDRLTVPMVDSLFEKLRDTKGIIFDLRGYPHETALIIASHLERQNSAPACEADLAAFLPYPQPSIPKVTTCYPLPRPFESTYKGKVVVLINEICQSQSEAAVWTFKALGATLVGSHTAGVCGSANTFYVPGGIPISFTDSTHTYPDGRPWNPIGFVPDIEVKPTIAGVRAGRDEVLDKAVQYLQQETGTGAAKK